MSFSARRPWTQAEVRALKALAPYGVEGCAVLLDRTQASVLTCAHRHGIQLRYSSTDQPLTHEARRLLERAGRSVHLPLCPMCAVRPATMVDHGICRPCWLSHLVDEYRAEVSETVHAREQARLRQVKHRGRVCASCRQVFSARPSSTATLCARCRAQ